MKHKKFKPKILYLFCSVMAIVVCGTIYLGITNLDLGGSKPVTDEDLLQKQRHLKEIEVMQALCDYDKDNIKDVSVHVEASENEILSANIFVLSKDKITDLEEQAKIKEIALGCLNLEPQKVFIEYADNAEYYD